MTCLWGRYGGQLRTDFRAVDARTTEVLVLVITSLWIHGQRLHALRIWTSGLCVVVDLEGTSKELLISQEFHELRGSFRAAADKIDGFAARGTILDIFAAVVEPALILLGPNIVDFSH